MIELDRDRDAGERTSVSMSSVSDNKPASASRDEIEALSSGSAAGGVSGTMASSSRVSGNSSSNRFMIPSIV